jgi:hypothetical protein
MLWGRIQITSFSSWHTNGFNKLEHLFMEAFQLGVMLQSSLLGPFVSYEENEML